ncbi:MAG: hypothetical protein KAS32_17645 [Candidatus Peribacteraceae bacterium]|nr:hypothetical protein [Candidatus Peribacteraceae bacterium]
MKHTKPLNYFLGILLLLSGVCGCAIIPHKEVNYCGKENTKVPYVELTKMYKTITDCRKDTNSCNVNVVVKPIIHNPTVFNLVGTLTCTYELDDYEARPLTSDTLIIGARKSKTVSVSNMISAPADRFSFITVGCSFRYKKRFVKEIGS